jgi:hypothetical protein
VRRRRDRGRGSLGERRGDGSDQARLDQRLVALHVHHDRVGRDAERARRLGDAVGAAGMVHGGHGPPSSRAQRRARGDVLVVGGDHHLRRRRSRAPSPRPRPRAACPRPSASIFPGSRVDCIRAGITTVKAAGTGAPCQASSSEPSRRASSSSITGMSFFTG